MKKRVVIGILSLIWLLPMAVLAAENSTKVSGYTIHHNALTTDFLSPAVAKAYNIRRSKNRGMLNISVIQDVPGTTGKPVTARITATAKNMIGQSQQVPLREVREGDAVYYIGDFLVGNREQLNFKLEVQPSGSDEKYTAHLSREFFTN